MSEIALVGDIETGLAFRTVGVHAVTPGNDEDAGAVIARLAREGYRIVLVTEPFAREAGEEIMKVMGRTDVCVLSIPASSGATGYGMELVRQMSIRALGADVLFKSLSPHDRLS